MMSTRLPTTRIHLSRQVLRPPNSRSIDGPIPRQFSHRPPRQLLVSQPSPRPQLPFLYPSPQLLSNGQYQLSRFLSISANQKAFIKDTAKRTVRYTFFMSLISILATIAGFGFMSERQERAFPSPHEWSLYTRFRFRRGKWYEVPENNPEHGFPNWAMLYAEYDIALKRLENTSKDGRGLREQVEGEMLIPGVGKAGYDLTAKSEEWRQGYFEVLLGMARAAERLEGWVSDKWKFHAWCPEFIASPTNPRPKATPPGMPPPPPPEEQRPIAEAPETFYMKILTTKGFTTHQRMTAALGYADWLSFKKLPDSAEEMYRWALDIAISGLPTPNTSLVVDKKTAIISSTAPEEMVTPNLIHATTNLATYFASKGDIASALPIYVSVLRARLNAEPSLATNHQAPADSSIVGTLLSLLNEPDYPPLPPTGDEPLQRKPEDICEEAALKNYIGEILFASASSSSQRRQALNWVREAVSNAKTGQSRNSISSNPSLKKKCETCEEVGLESWGKIMTYLAAEAREKRDIANGGGLRSLSWKLWGTGELEKEVEELEDEEEGVVMRLNKLRKRLLQEEYDEMDRKYAKTFVF